MWIVLLGPPPISLARQRNLKAIMFWVTLYPSEVAVKVTDLLTVHECLQSGAVGSSVPMGENYFSRASEENICSEGIRECLFTAEKDQIWGHVACRRSTLKLLANIQNKKRVLGCVSCLCLCLPWVRCLDVDPFICKLSFTGEEKKRQAVFVLRQQFVCFCQIECCGSHCLYFVQRALLKGRQCYEAWWCIL